MYYSNNAHNKFSTYKLLNSGWDIFKFTRIYSYSMQHNDTVYDIFCKHKYI